VELILLYLEGFKMVQMRILIWALAALIALGGMGMAEDSGTVNVNADLPYVVSITVPTEPISWDFTLGENTKAVTGVEVAANQNWKLEVNTYDTDYDGKFKSTENSSILGSLLNANAGGSDVVLDDENEPVVLKTGTPQDATEVPFSLKQHISYTDAIEDDYTAILQFTVSAN
jgi:hypothetical protein